MTASSGCIRVSARLLSGENLEELTADPRDTILDLKRRLAPLTKTPLQFLGLVFEGLTQSPKDSATLRSAGFHASSSVNVLVIRCAPIISLLTIVSDDELLAKYLVECGADVSEQHNNGDTVFLRVVRKGFLKVFRLVTDHPEFSGLNARDANGLNALHLAGTRGHTEIFKEILDRRDFEGINDRDLSNRTVLHLAAWNGHTAICKLLLARRDFNGMDLQDDVGRTALHWAAAEGHGEVCNLILHKVSYASTFEKDAYDESVHDLVQRNGRQDGALIQHLKWARNRSFLERLTSLASLICGQKQCCRSSHCCVGSVSPKQVLPNGDKVNHISPLQTRRKSYRASRADLGD